MALLCQEQGKSSVWLLEEHLVGRGRECALRLEKPYVSTQHALIRWNREAWELLDRGSRNGTRLGSELIESRRGYRLSEGAVLSFGHPAERWVLRDASAPQVLILDLDSSTQIPVNDGMMGLPSNDDPTATLYRALDGTWKLEQAEGAVRPLDNEATFEIDGTRYRFFCPTVAERTVTVEAREYESPTLEFMISRDEEYVALSVLYPSRRVDLGNRNHNYLLLMLARARGQEAALSEPARGWLFKDDIARALRMTQQQVDGEVFRVRKHFAQHGLDEGATIIERRPRTKQLRLGIPRYRIVQL